MCRKQPGIAIGRLCDKCDGKCPVCDSYVRPTTLVRICDECSFGNYQNKCVVCGGEVRLSPVLLFLVSSSEWYRADIFNRASRMPFTASSALASKRTAMDVPRSSTSAAHAQIYSTRRKHFGIIDARITMQLWYRGLRCGIHGPIS